MKAIVTKYLAYIPYPGAATRREQLHNFLDKCLLVASANEAASTDNARV